MSRWFVPVAFVVLLVIGCWRSWRRGRRLDQQYRRPLTPQWLDDHRRTEDERGDGL